MSPYVISPEPKVIDEDVAALSEIAATGAEVDGQAQVADSIWVVYGHISYDGEVAVGVYQDAAMASEMLRAAPRYGLAPGRAVP